MIFGWQGYVDAFYCHVQSTYTYTRKDLTAYDIDNELESWYARCSQTIKCPFFKRRTADFLDATSHVFQFLIARHKSILPLSFIDQNYKLRSPPGCKSSGEPKQRGLSMSELAEIIQKDWDVNTVINTGMNKIEYNGNNKGYYITGKMTRSVYRDDCFFDGPDPDMPVKGLRKYLAASSQLFHQGKSTCELQCIKYDEVNRVITAQWKLQGVLNLPWQPILKPYSGTTRYYVDDEGMIVKHIEEWDISMLNAFVCTLLPTFSIFFE